MRTKHVSSFEGAVVPPYAKDPTPNNYSTNPSRGMYLRIGRVIAAYSPQDSGSQSKKVMEYDVEVVDGTPTSMLANFKILRCQVADSFGGAADFSRWTPRVCQQADPVSAEPENLVLVQCINGKLFQGVIVGGMPNSLNGEDYADGHSFVWQFNGVRAQVDKEGQFNLSFKGATNADGTLASGADSNASGATFQITKDGSIKFFTKDENQFLGFNHTSRTVALTSDKEMKLTSKSALIKTSSTGVHLGDATDDMVKGSTYRTQEAAMNNVVANAMQALSATLTPLLPAISAGAADPVLTVAKPALVAVGTAITAIQAAAASISLAVSQFEALSATYLSTKNKLD